MGADSRRRTQRTGTLDVPKDPRTDDAVILEFKTQDTEDEATLPGTVAVVLKQIEEKKYSAGLNSRGI